MSFNRFYAVREILRPIMISTSLRHHLHVMWCGHKGHKMTFRRNDLATILRSCKAIDISHCGRVTLFGDKNLRQHLFRQWPVTTPIFTWKQQAITWTNIDFLLATLFWAFPWEQFCSKCTLQWRHNERDSLSNDQRLYCCSTVCSGAVRASNAENVSIWWRHHAKLLFSIISLKIIFLRFVPHLQEANDLNIHRNVWTCT